MELKQATLSTGTPGQTLVNLNYAGADHETDTLNVVGGFVWSTSFIVTPASGTQILLKAKDTGSATITARGADVASGLTGTRITLLRIN